MPIDREKVLQAAQKFVERRRFDRAIAEYQKIIQEDPTDARILLKIGDLQARMDAHPDAIATYERVARYYAQQGFSVKAIAVYKQIREMIRKYVPRLADQYRHIIPQLGELYQQLGLTGDALATYDEHATLLQNAGRDREAIGVFRKIVELNESNPLARLRLAEALSRDKEFEEAQREFGKAADILLEMGRRDDALKVMERLLHHQADPARAKRAAELYLERGLPNDGMMALAKLQICFQADQRDLQTLDLLARAFVCIGQASKSVEVRKEAVRIAREQGKLEEARALLGELMLNAPHDEVVRAMAHSMMPAAREEPRVDTSAGDDGEIEVSESEAPLTDTQGEIGLGSASAYDDFDFPDEGPTSRDAEPEPPMIMVDETLEAAEDINGEEPYRGVSPVSDVLANAEAFRKLGLHPKAIETVRIGLELNPQSLELHEELRDLLVESGDHGGAVDEMITMAAMYVDASEQARAADQLNRVILLDPAHARAREMLLELGYEPPTSTRINAVIGEQIEPSQLEVIAREELASYAQAFPEQAYPPSSGPLPSYDLEEIGPAEAMPLGIAPSPIQTGGARGPFLSTDDPFAGEVAPQQVVDEPFAGDIPLPSFPLDERARLELVVPDYSLSDTYDSVGEAYESAVSVPAAEQILEEVPAASPLAGTQAFRGGESLEEALEEADFFASRNLFDDALSIIEEQLERFPNHPLLVERQREVREAATAGGGGDQAQEKEAGTSVPPSPVEDRSFDIAASLSALDNLSDEKPVAPFASAVDVEEVFAKFKEGVRRQVADTDSQSHYDLGVAYKEMGLARDAIGEFEMAARDPGRECVCHSMVGMIHVEQGDLDAAVDSFIRGLHSEHRSVEQELALYYQLGDIYERKGNPGEALYYFKMVAHRDVAFRDVALRIQALQAATGQGSSRLRTAIGEDEFDRAFDDLFGDK